MLPLAHIGHYVVWAAYALPVLLVIAGIVYSNLSQRKDGGEPPAGGAEGSPRTDRLARPQDSPPRQDPRAGRSRR